MDKHNNLPGLRLHLYSVILHSNRSRSKSFCNQFLFRWHNNLPSLRLHLYSVILHSDRSRSRSRSFCNQFLFFVVLNFLSSLTTCKLTWYLAFLTKGDMLTTRNPHFTKIFTYFRPVSQKKKKKKKKKNSKIQIILRTFHLVDFFFFNKTFWPNYFVIFSYKSSTKSAVMHTNLPRAIWI